MSNETPKEIAILTHLSEIHKLLDGNADLADSVAEKLEHLPVGKDLRHALMSRRSELSYYNERFAMELAPILDRIIVTGLPMDFRLDQHPSTSLRTLYLKVYQAWLWLIDKHPEKDKYAALKRDTKITQRKSFGLRITMRTMMGTGLSATEVNEDMDSLIKLQNKISDFLALDIIADTMFDEKRLSLDEQQQQIVKDSLAGIPNVIVESNRVRILRRI